MLTTLPGFGILLGRTFMRGHPADCAQWRENAMKREIAGTTW